MRFRIDFLREATEAHSVCHARSVRALELEVAHFQAQAWAKDAKAKFGAEGFQIRWMEDRGRIVFVESFDGPPPSLH
jgi:hypothetical protein